MSNVQIPNLTPATSLGGTEQFEGVQSGTSVRITAQQIAAYTAAAYPAPGISSVSASAPISASTVSGAVSLSLDLQGITNSYLATMSAGTVKANVTGGSASPSDVTVSALLDTFGTTKGSLLVRDTSAWTALTSGTSGQVLTANGTTAVPSWQTLSISPGTLTPTGVVAGTYGSASTVPRYTVLASGQLSAATNVPIVIPNTSVTGLGTMAVQDANGVAIVGGAIDGTDIGLSTPANGAFTSLSASGTSSFGTINSGTWQGTPIAVTYGGTGASTASGARTNLGAAASGANSDITSLSGLTTPLSAPQGGTGFGSYTTGDLLYADTSSTLARLNDVATGNALISGGVGVAPAWGKVGLTTHVSGILPVANGGSGASSLTGFLKGNGTSPFTTQATIDNADLTNSSLTIGSTSISLGSTATTIAGLTTLTLTQDPSNALEAATKQYVDNEVLSVSNLTYHASAEYGTTADLGSVTYSNGTGGVGATLTQSGAPSVLIIDGYTFTASDVINATRVLVKDQTSGLQNGVYVVTNEGSGAANWQLTRATDFDATGTGPNNIQTGAAVFVTAGAVNASTGWVMNTTGTITVGSTSLNWTQISSSASVTVTSPLQKIGSVISLTTVPVNLGGTNLTSYTQYGLLYAPTSGSLGQVGVGSSGQPLLSGGAGSAPAFGALSLSGSGVSGTLGVSNGGTGTSTAFTTGSVVFAGASGVYSQDADLFWDNTNKFLGIGSNTPRTSLTIVSATQTTTPSLAGLPAGTDLYIVGADAANTRITQDAYGTGNYPAYTGRQARGTAASPTASQTGDILVEFTGRGYGDTAFSASSIGRIDIEAAETFTDTAQGTYISLHTSALGAASAVERFRIGPSGQFGIGGASYGTSGYVLTSGGASAAPTWSQISVSSVSGTLPVANGGTGLTSYTIGDLIYADGSASLAKLADVATGNALISGGVGTAPSWGKIGLTTHVSGTLPIGNGGTGVTSTPTNGQLLIGNGTGYSVSTLTAGSSNISITNGAGSITLDVNSSPTLTGLTVNGDAVISANSANAALRITQTGAGNALLVEDSANPDSTPFVVDSSGRVIVGTTSSIAGIGGTPGLIQVIGTSAPTISVQNWTASLNDPARLEFDRSGSSTIGTRGIVSDGADIGRIRFAADDGVAFIEAANILAEVDGTPGTNDMPGRLVFSTTADGASTTTERMRINNAGNISIGTLSASAGTTLRIGKTVTGATIGYGILNNGIVQSDVTTEARLFATSASTDAVAFTLGGLTHFYAAQTTLGASSAITNQYGFAAVSNLTGAANNYGFYGGIAAGTSRTITTVDRTSNVVTITTSVAHGYLAGQSVTVAATTNTGVNGTFTIASVPTTTTFTYAQVGADIPSSADTGSTVVVGRYNFFANGTAPNYFGGATTVETSSTDAALRVTQTGAGNALLVEDSANPDSTPFVVSADGTVIIGNTTTGATLYDVQSLTTDGASYLAQRYAAGTGGAFIRMDKSRSATIGTNTVVNSGDTIGTLEYRGADGTNFITAAQIQAEVDGTPGTNDMPGRLVFSTTADGASTATERMRIDSSGNVGIGKTPSLRFEVAGTGSGTTIASRTQNLGTAAADNAYQYIQVGGSTNPNQISAVMLGRADSVTAGRVQYEHLSDAMALYTANSERMRINSSGNVGIGTTSPSSRLDIVGANTIVKSNASSGYGSFYANGATGNAAYYFFAVNSTETARIYSDSANYLAFGTGSSGTERMRIDSSGRVGINTASPATMLHVVGTSAIPALETNNILETSTISATAATGTINYDVATQSVLYYTSNASANWTLNIRASSGTSLNTFMATGDTVTIVHMVTQGATPYYNNVVQVDGSTVTPKWQGGTAPSSGNASSIDIYTYTVIKTGSAAFTVLASQTQFK